MQISNVRGDLMVTHALGSCLGITVHDQVAGIGGMLHVMLPNSIINPSKAKANPFMFVDTGMPDLLRRVLAAGAVRNRLAIKVAGGSSSQSGNTDHFVIGKRNYIMLRKVLWRYDLLLDAEEVGGNSPRNMYLEIGSGRVWINFNGKKKDL